MIGRRSLLIRLGGGAASAALLAGCAPAAATVQGARIRDLYQLLLMIGIGVALLIWVLVTWSIVRYRRHRDEPIPQTRNNIPLEVAWTIVPAVLVLILFILTFQTQVAVDAEAPDPAVDIAVTAFTWQWQFRYAGSGVVVTGTTDHPPEMVVPVNETIHIDLTSSDVDHSFYVPRFLFKRDAIPGRTTSFDFIVQSAGVYPGQCAEFCGLQHAYMIFTVRAVDRATYDAWLASEASP
jgi:cytochrome c oxidase subunit 2